MIALLFALLTPGCERERVDRTEERMKLLEADRAFSRMSVDSGSAKAFWNYLAEDATQFPVGEHPITGKDSIYRALMGSAQTYTLQWEPQASDVAMMGDLGYTWGVYSLQFRDSLGHPQSRYGKYVDVWKKQTDGSWKVLLDIGNSSPAPRAN